jgi:RNA polymerase sigma-70 factor (ECF subfamily)
MTSSNAAESALPFDPASASEEAAKLSAADLVVALFDRYRTPLLRYITAFGLPIQDAEEIAQEVFLSLFQHLQRGKSREYLAGWVFRAAHNLALKRRASSAYKASIYKACAAEEPPTLPDPSPNPEDQCAANQSQQRLRGVFRALPEQDRQCLALRAEGLRYRDISAVLGISLGSVAASLTRSLARLTRAAGR